MFASNELSFKPTTPDRLPPQEVDAEVEILGGILLDPDAISRVCDRLTPEMFYISAHSDIYREMLILHQEGKPTDLRVVTSHLADKECFDSTNKKINFLAKVGGRNKLASLLDATVSAINIDALAELVREKFLRRELIKISHRNIQLAYDCDIDIAKILEDAQQKTFNLTQSLKNDQPELVHISQVMQDTVTTMEERASGQIPLTSSGFYDLDAMLSGFEQNQHIVIAGRTAMGKTAFALDIACSVASDQQNQKPVFFFSLEMDGQQLARRIISKQARIENSYLKTARLSQNQWEDIFRVVDASGKSKLYICDRSSIDVLNIYQSVRQAIAKTGEKPGAIFVDHIHILAGTEEGDINEQSKISKASRMLKLLTSKKDGFGCPVFTLAQLNRGVESRQSKRPMLSDLRSSGSIEQDANVVLMLYRDEYYNPDTPDRGIAEVIVAKSRDSATGTVKLLFDDTFAQFKNLSKSQY